MDLRTCHCRNRRCEYCGKTGAESALRRWGSDSREPRMRYEGCGWIYEARDATAYVGIRTDLQIFALGAQLLAEGMSIRATARVLGVDKDTMCRWVRQLGEHWAGVATYHFRQLHLTECQLDELWTFVRKKEDHLTPLEHMQAEYGDAWIWIAFAPLSKIVPVWVAGKRTLRMGRQLVKELKNRLDAHIPFFTSDELPHYADALLEVYGETVQPPRTGKRGRPRQPYKVPPDDLLYAVVCKHREGSHLVEVTTEVVYGSPQRIAELLQHSPTTHTISTYGVERNNLTIRQHARRLTRKVNAFSKDHAYLEQQLALSFAYYHFVIPHQGLRQKLARPVRTNGDGSPKRWQARTPAMAANLTDHIWSIDELLSFRVPPKHLWAS